MAKIQKNRCGTEGAASARMMKKLRIIQRKDGCDEKKSKKPALICLYNKWFKGTSTFRKIFSSNHPM
jgi:hypothetical protein